jgi:hypothetical protein
MEQLNL